MNKERSCENCKHAKVINEGFAGNYYEPPSPDEYECNLDKLEPEVIALWEEGESYERIAQSCDFYDEPDFEP